MDKLTVVLMSIKRLNKEKRPLILFFCRRYNIQKPKLICIYFVHEYLKKLCTVKSIVI